MTHAEALIERRSANQALLESRLGECADELRHVARILAREPRYTWQAAEAQAIADRSEDALRTIREGEKL